MAVCGLSLVAVSGGYYGCHIQASHCGGFSCEAWILGLMGSVVVANGSSCPKACGIFPDRD